MDNVTPETTGIGTKRAGIAGWIGPAFLLAAVAIFIVVPWSLKGKLDAVCYGI